MSPTRPLKRARVNERSRPESAASFSFEKHGLSTTTAQGKFAFKWLLSGKPVEQFFSEQFEKCPFLQENEPSKFQELISVGMIQDLVLSGKLCYGSDIDVTRYNSRVGRETLNEGVGQYANKEVWARLTKSGCSVRLLRPQEHSDALWRLCAHLECFLGCAVGANAYLTPAKSQGFAPHFDDIDAFVCQVHGRKRWRVYGPRPDKLDDLPRASSVDFSPEDIEECEVLYDRILKPGDMLYLPRGTIHQAECPEDGDAEGSVLDRGSLHVTISAFQQWTWADLLLESFEVAVRSAAAEDRALRRTLPLRFSDFSGISKGDARKQQREWFEKMVQGMIRRVAKKYPTDAAGDALAARFMRRRLPPPPRKQEKHGRKAGQAQLKSMVRAVGAGVARVIMDNSKGGDGLPRVVHCLNNTRSAGETPLEEAEVSCLPEEAFAVDFAIGRYPEPVMVKDLPLDNKDDRVELARGLIDMGILEVVL